MKAAEVDVAMIGVPDTIGAITIEAMIVVVAAAAAVEVQAAGPVIGLVRLVTITTLHIDRNAIDAKPRSPTPLAVATIGAVAIAIAAVATVVAAALATDTQQSALARAKTFTTLGDFHSSRLSEHNACKLTRPVGSVGSKCVRIKAKELHELCAARWWSW
jgi:hypothetical protein